MDEPPTIPSADDRVISIRRDWKDTRSRATVKLGQIKQLHWSGLSGGKQHLAGRNFIHGFVQCTEVVGNIRHSCIHGPPPHRIKVCVVEKDNKGIWDELLAMVGEKPKYRPYIYTRTTGSGPDAKVKPYRPKKRGAKYWFKHRERGRKKKQAEMEKENAKMNRPPTEPPAPPA